MREEADVFVLPANPRGYADIECVRSAFDCLYAQRLLQIYKQTIGLAFVEAPVLEAVRFSVDAAPPCPPRLLLDLELAPGTSDYSFEYDEARRASQRIVREFRAELAEWCNDRRVTRALALTWVGADLPG